MAEETGAGGDAGAEEETEQETPVAGAGVANAMEGDGGADGGDSVNDDPFGGLGANGGGAAPDAALNPFPAGPQMAAEETQEPITPDPGG